MRDAAALFGVVFTLMSLSAQVAPGEPLKVAVISQSANNWPLFVAEQKGFFQRARLEVEVIVTADSAKQMDGLASGAYHITQQAADHFVGAVEAGKDVFIFMTIARPVFDFVVTPGIRAIGDLRGKTIALDRPTTGYWLLFQKAFARSGLPPDAYKTLPNLTGAENRFAALKEGRAQGTFLNPPLSLEAIAQGFPRLTTLAEHFPDFPATSGGARRSWAKANEALLVGYVRATISAIEWLLDANHRDEAIEIFKNRVKIDERHLQPTYDAFVRAALVRGAQISKEGMRQVVDLMAESGQLKKPLLPPERYADPAYQQKAAQEIVQ